MCYGRYGRDDCTCVMAGMEEMTVFVYGWYGRDDCTCVMAGMEEMTVHV